MESKLSFNLVLSLKEMALRKIAVSLMNHPDILATSQTVNESDFFQTIEKNMRNRLSKLGLPESLISQIIPILKAVGTEIQKWNYFERGFLEDSTDKFDSRGLKIFHWSATWKVEYGRKVNLHVVKNLCWTAAGAVDYRRTAENLAFSDEIDVEKRFKLACLYCLEDCIPLLWDELPEENKREFCREVGISPQVRIPFRFSKYILKKLFDYHDWRYDSAVESFEGAALLGHVTLAEYYFGQLSKEERNACLVPFAKKVVRYRSPKLIVDLKNRKEKLSDVFIFLLSLMSPEEQMLVFKELPCEVLRCFLDWPWQDFFLDVADIVWTFLPESKYEQLLWTITRVIDRFEYYPPNILQEFFLRSPRNFNKYFLDHSMYTLFCAEDFETIRVIFRNIEPADRVKIVFSETIFTCLEDSILSKRRCFVEELIREAALTKQERERLKRDFSKYLTQRRVKGKGHKCRRFLVFLDGMDASPAEKRGLEDETLAEVKKSHQARK